MTDLEMKDQMESVRDTALNALKETKADWTKRFDDLKAAGGDVKALETQLNRAVKRIEEAEARLNAPVGDGNSPYSEKSVGQMFIEAEGLQPFVGRIRSMDGKSGYTVNERFSLPLQDLFLAPSGTKTLVDSTAVGSSTPGILVPQRVGGIVKPGVRRIRVRDLIPRFPTTANAIEFVKENAFTNAASPQVEGSAKAESALTFTIDYANVKTIAHWIPATRQVLADFSQLQAYIDQRLIDGLKDVEDAQLLRGDGTGQNLSGLSTEATAYDTARDVASDTNIDQLNHAISQIEDVNLTADGIVLHPRDWRAMQLLKTEEGGANKGVYILGGPRGDAEPMLWGLPVATSTAVTVGKFYVGAFQTHSAVWDRMDAQIDVATQHDDYFIKNKIAIRCEERLTFTVYRSDAFVYGTL